MPSKSPGRGCWRVTCQELLAVLLALVEELGVVLGDGVGDGGLDRGEPAGGEPGGELGVDVGRGGLGEGVGGLGDLAGLPRLHVELFDEPPDPREPVLEVEGVGDQLHPGQGGDAERGGDRFGRERGDGRGALATQGLVDVQDAGQCVAGPGGHPGVGGGGVQHAPLRGQPQLVPLVGARGVLLLLEQGEDPVGVEVLDHHRLSHRVHFEHGTSQPVTTDSQAPKTGWLSGSGETRR